MNLFAIRKHVDRLLHPVVSSLAKLPITANAWTLFGALVGLIGGAVFFYGYWWWGLLLLLVRGLIDHIDGFKARNFNQRSTFGAVMDDVCDRWVLGVMFAGGCLNLSYDYPHILIVLGFGITGALTNVGTAGTGLGPQLVVIEPTGKYAYVSSSYANDVYGYSIDPASGLLTGLSGNPFVTGASGAKPLFINIDNSGQFAYTANNGSAQIAGFTIDPNTPSRLWLGGGN